METVVVVAVVVNWRRCSLCSALERVVMLSVEVVVVVNVEVLVDLQRS